MATIIPTNVTLREYDTNTLLKLESRGASTYQAKMSTKTNSLLSSVFVKSIDAAATLAVNYYDTTTGTEADNERYDLANHELVTVADAGKTKRLTVTRIHNKPIVEAIVTGGNVEFGLYVTGVSSFASDLDAALVKDGQVADLANDKGMPFVCLKDDGTFQMVECTSDGLKVDGVFSEEGLTTPVNESVAFVAADTEYSYSFPEGANSFCVINESDAVIKASWAMGDSTTNYWKIIPGQTFVSPPKIITAPTTTIYWQANKVVTAASGVKVISWS